MKYLKKKLNHRKISILFFSIFISFSINAGCDKKQNPDQKHSSFSDKKDPIKKYAQTITISELRDHVYYLASDEMEGRRSGSNGSKAAANYIANNFEKAKLKGFFSEDAPYFQKFNMEKKEQLECFLESDFSSVEIWKDFLEVSSDFEGEKEIELLLLGYGRDADFEGINLAGKLAAFFSGDPESSESAKFLDRFKILRALERGAAGYLMITSEEERFLNYIHRVKQYFPAMRYYQAKTSQQALNSVRKIDIVSSAVAKLLGMNRGDFEKVREKMKQGKDEKTYKTKLRMKTTYKKFGVIPTENVLGYFEGTDKKNEYVIVTAHYDGRGMDGNIVLNGANDNATGVAAIIEIAEAFSAAIENGFRPRRSIIFMMPTAEELLAIGSSYYVENPAVPLKNTVVNINVDAIGREDAEHPNFKNHIFVYCSKNGKNDLKAVRAKAEKIFALNLRIKIKEKYSGSDNVSFEKRGIPAIAFTSGQCKDHHGPGDDPRIVQYKKLEKVTRLIFATIWEIANRDRSISRILAN